jgi:hypothetical protein
MGSTHGMSMLPASYAHYPDGKTKDQAKGQKKHGQQRSQNRKPEAGTTE